MADPRLPLLTLTYDTDVMPFMCSGFIVFGCRSDCYPLLSAVFLAAPGHGHLAQDISQPLDKRLWVEHTLNLAPCGTQPLY